MIDFEPTEEQRIMVDAVSHFARATLGERVRAIELAREVPEDMRRSAHEMGLGMVAIPEAAGGQGLGLLTALLLEEALATVDAGAAFALPGAASFGMALVELGTEAQCAEWLAPFSGADGHARFGAVAWSEPKAGAQPGFTTSARLDGDGYVIDGDKAFVLHAGIAQSYLVFAQLDRDAGWNGIAAFHVAGDQAGLSVGERYDTLGLDAARFAPVKLAGVRVGQAARVGGADPEAFVRGLLRYFAKHALVVASRAVGLAQHAFDLAREYCDTRMAFGKPIGHFQAVAFNLADRLMDVESARWMLWRAAWSWDQNNPERACLLASAQASAHALEVAMRCADDGVGLHGGAGFIRDVIAEKLMRDAKQLQLCCATSELSDQLAAAVELGCPLDPALLLPTPETQPIFT